MKYSIYAIRDDATGEFSLPFFCQNDDVAHRTMFDVLSNRESMLFLHSEDYHVYVLGDFDSETGLFQALDAPRSFREVAFYRRLVVHADSRQSDFVEEQSDG